MHADPARRWSIPEFAERCPVTLWVRRPLRELRRSTTTVSAIGAAAGAAIIAAAR
jgi:hypothetical protein